MENKVLQFDNSIERYRSLAFNRLDNEDYIGALDMLFSALNKEYSLEIIKDIAVVYANMELYELSNRYWFTYLHKAKKEDIGIALEEIAFNYFYMDNLWASSYYFNKKIEFDGQISRDNIPDEIVKHFAESIDIKDKYKIAYPFEETDYTEELKKGRTAIALGDLRTAKKTFKKVPKKSPQGFEAEKELAVAEFLSGDVEKGIEITRKLIIENGESCALLCNLSSMYKSKEDKEKALYYYKKALTYPKKQEEDTYKLATCALENEDHEKAVELLTEILKERGLDVRLTHLYGLALLNCGKLTEGAKELNELYRIDPTNLTNKYFANLANKMVDGVDTKGLTPFLYNGEIPYKEGNKRLSIIGKVVEYDQLAREKELKKPYVNESVKWGLEMGEEEVAKACIFILSSSTNKENIKYLLDKLLDDEFSADVKSIIIFMLVLAGCKNKMGVVSGGYYTTFKPKKLPFENEEKGKPFETAYALCLSRLAFTGFNSFNQLAIEINKAYKTLKNYENIENLTKEIAVVCTILSDSKKINTHSACRIFNAKEDRVKEILNYIKSRDLL
ncbi:MAG: hypothetical protein IKW33_03315 [Clostridia bacterium]|nr:hypothetical protein [Clostridia bacterium]